MSGGAVDPAAEAARSLSRRLAALEEGTIRARAAARALAALTAREAATVISLLARDGDPDQRAATAAIGRALVDPEPELPYAWRAELYAEATARGLAEVGALVVAPPPLRAYQAPRDAADARLAHLTLGHKKAFARGQRDPDLLARLAAEGDPSVVTELLRNPQLTEPFVVRIAARRPCRPETLRCVFESRRWRTRPLVLRALARNPYAEPEIALKIVVAMAPADQAELAADGALHPLVRAVADRLRALRRGEAS